jgi:hypothetical protein
MDYRMLGGTRCFIAFGNDMKSRFHYAEAAKSNVALGGTKRLSEKSVSVLYRVRSIDRLPKGNSRVPCVEAQTGRDGHPFAIVELATVAAVFYHSVTGHSAGPF